MVLLTVRTQYARSDCPRKMLFTVHAVQGTTDRKIAIIHACTRGGADGWAKNQLGERCLGELFLGRQTIGRQQSFQKSRFAERRLGDKDLSSLHSC